MSQSILTALGPIASTAPQSWDQGRELSGCNMESSPRVCPPLAASSVRGLVKLTLNSLYVFIELFQAAHAQDNAVHLCPAQEPLQTKLHNRSVRFRRGGVNR